MAMPPVRPGAGASRRAVLLACDSPLSARHHRVAKVPSASDQQSFSLRGMDRSSCPIPLKNRLADAV